MLPQIVKKCDDMSIRLEYRHSTGVEQTDRQTDEFGITISRSACIARWRATKTKKLSCRRTS